MEQVNRKAIRPDFFYRIHVLPITLPPLRERKEDIPLLVEHFMALYRQGEEPFRLPEKIMETLFAYNWPGNVRELQNVIQRYLTEKKLDFLPSADLPEIEEALKNQKWKKGKAADALGVSRNTLFRKMKQNGLNG